MGKGWDKPWAVGFSETGYTDGKRMPRPSFGSNRNPVCRTCHKHERGTKKCQCATPDFDETPRTSSMAFGAWCEAWGREALRVTKPGGYLLAFGGTRTHHRLVCGLEDAGWIIRDELTWVYASGFPKGRANLKPAHEPIVLARKPGPLRALNIDAARIGVDGGHEGAGPGPSQGILGDGLNGSRAEPVPGLGRWPSNLLLQDPELFDVANPGVVGSGATDAGGGFATRGRSDNAIYGGGKGYNVAEIGQDVGYGDSGGYSRFFIVPKADRGDREPVLRGQLEEQRKAHDAETIIERVHSPDHFVIAAYLRQHRERLGLSKSEMDQRLGTVTLYSWYEGRPAGIQLPTPEMWGRLKDILGFDDLHDAEMTEVHEVGLEERDARSQSQNIELMRRVAGLGKQRENAHPTVKPTDLMRHLVRLVTPPGGTVLDCFLGSGSTAIACELEGFPWIGIEQDAGYVAIAEARLNGVQRGMGLAI